jgi:hypothetical protein
MWLAKLQGHSAMVAWFRKCTRVEFGIQQQYSIVKEGLRTNMMMLRPVESWKADMLRVMIRLVVAMRLQTQHHFLLCTSNNTSSIQKNIIIGSLANSDKLMQFLSCNLVLRNPWMNRHNSRQSCNLGELINQSEIRRGDYGLTWSRMELEQGMEMLNKPEHTRILECFRPPKRNTIHPIFLYCFWEWECYKAWVYVCCLRRAWDLYPLPSRRMMSLPFYRPTTVGYIGYTRHNVKVIVMICYNVATQ